MDFSFHLQQGQHLLFQPDINSIRQAMTHFVKANEMLADEDMAKPKTLYFLAVGNYIMGELEQSYRLAQKGKKCLDLVVQNSMIDLSGMRAQLGEKEIDEHLFELSRRHPELVGIDLNPDSFDENWVNSNKFQGIDQGAAKKKVVPEFRLDQLGTDVLMATYFGLSRQNDQLVYFDKQKGDVLSHVQGYFTSLLGDQRSLNRILARRIMNNEPVDVVDEERYILIDRLRLQEFLEEYKKHTENKEPYYSYTDIFVDSLLEEFSYMDDIILDDIVNSEETQKDFQRLFKEKNAEKLDQFENEFLKIIHETEKSLAKKWILNQISD